MRVVTNSTSTNIIAQIQALNLQQTQLQSEVSSGLRITQPSDDPAAFGRVMIDDSQSRALSQYGSNANTALQVSQATSSNLQQINSISDRIGQLATLGTGTAGASAMSAYAAEVDQLIQQTVQLGNSQLNNNYLFAGTAVNTPPYTTTTNAQGQITAVAYNGNTAQNSIPLSSTASIASGSDGATNQGLSSFMNNLITLRNALSSGNSAAVSAVQTNLSTDEDTITNAMAAQGAVQMRIQVTQAQQTSLSQSLTQLVSGETGAYLPSTVVKLTQAQNAYQAAIQSAASIMQHSLLTYLPVQ